MVSPIDAQNVTRRYFQQHPPSPPAADPIIEAIRPIWRDVKARSSERSLVLFARRERRLLLAIDSDARTLRRLVPGKAPYNNTPIDDGIYFRIEDHAMLVGLAAADGFSVIIPDGIDLGDYAKEASHAEG